MVSMSPPATPKARCVVQADAPRHPLRQQAETLAAQSQAPTEQDFHAMSLVQFQQTLHELRVQQIELEMQNEELRRTQQELAAEQARYSDLYDLAPVGYCTVDATTGLILHVNLTTAHCFGWARGALVKRLFSQCIFLEDQDIYYLLRNNLLAAGEPQSCELRMVKHDGTLIWMHLNAVTVVDTDGAQVLRIALTNISSQKQEKETLYQNQTLLKSEAFTRAIMDSVGAEIAVLDRNGVIVAVNQPWRDFSFANGLVHGDASLHTDIGTNYLAACNASAAAMGEDPAQNVCTGIQAVLNGSLPYFTREYACNTPQQAHWFSMHVTPLGPDRQGVVISHSDITERKQNAAALLGAKAEAEKANHAKSRFLAAASHDLRQPLSALSLYIGVLKGRVTPENHDLMARIEACCDSLTKLLTDLLDVSKLDAGVITPKLSAFVVDDFLRTLTTVHAAEANLKGLRLHLHACRGLVAHTDPSLLARVVNNLISNAIRYTHKGGVLLACRRHAGALWIEVWDTGIGLPQDKTEAIFDEFTQLGDDARNRGSGLGLAIVAKTAAVLGLKIRVRSRVGRGSMFAVEFPIGRAHLATESQALETRVRPLRIGLVEDNTDVRQALVLALENFGHQVVSASNGSALLKHLGAHAPDIVISDYRLGAGETGFHVIEAARTVFGADLPAIIITGDTDPAVIRSMTDRGIALHFKPLHLDSLMAFITQATERRTR